MHTHTHTHTHTHALSLSISLSPSLSLSLSLSLSHTHTHTHTQVVDYIPLAEVHDVAYELVEKQVSFAYTSGLFHTLNRSLLITYQVSFTP